jgi:hypothetical protein
MNIKITPSPAYTRPVSDYIARKLGDTYANGQLERAEDVGNNTRHAFARLVNLLADKGLLNAQDITNLVEDYSTAELVKE